MRITRKLAMFWRSRRFEANLAEEVRIHREMAAHAARRGDSVGQFGSEAYFLEESRAVWGFGWLDSLGQDIRYALRGFRKTPLFALTVVGTIGVALGLNTTLFTLFDAYVLRPLAVRDPQNLYEVFWKWCPERTTRSTGTSRYSGGIWPPRTTGRPLTRWSPPIYSPRDNRAWTT